MVDNNPTILKQELTTSSITTDTPLTNVDQAIKYSHIFPHLDIIASSRHIKTLFKIPFSKAPFSLAVHRIGKTLILDDFFLNLDSSKTQNGTGTKVKDEPLLEDQRLSRFLSLPELSIDIPAVTEQHVVPFKQPPPPSHPIVSVPIRQRRCSEGSGDRTNTHSPALVLSSVPQPHTLTTIGAMNVSYGPSLRDTFWRFEDYSMLLGCDLPIFGMGTHPAVSLYVEDATRPINVLTGIDLWLDNLMNNVPEVLMAYRVENVIRYCEVVDLDTIPTLPNCNFSPDLISNICSNILHFLKANCTKEGHTYWLLRDSNEDIIKLYDLTSLVDVRNVDEISRQFENPFLDPVALLFYKVATQMCRKLSSNSDTYLEELGTVKHMLEQVIRLLQGSGRQSKLELSAYEVLAEIFLSDKFIQELLEPNNPPETTKTNPKNRKKKSKNTERKLEKIPSFLNWPMDSETAGTELNRLTPPPIKLGSNEERAKITLDYVITALELGRKFQKETEFFEKYVCEMMRKAAVCFYILGQSNFTLGCHGRTVKYVEYCLATILRAGDSRNSELKFKVLQLLGDTLCLIGSSKDITLHQTEFSQTDTELEPILSLCHCHIVLDSFTPPLHISPTPSDNTLNSIECYLFIESHSKNSTTALYKRLGNSYNEIGLVSMDSILNQNELSSSTKMDLAKSAFTYFQNAIHYFTQSDNVLNLVLVHSNCARLMRICAFRISTYQIEGKNIFTPQIQEYCNESISAYQTGIMLLGNGEYTELCIDLKCEQSNVKLQLIGLMIKQELQQELINEISHLIVDTISVLEELAPIRNDTIFSLSLTYHYFGKIQFERMKNLLKTRDEKPKKYFHLTEKYLFKSNHMLDTSQVNNNKLVVYKSKNLLLLHDLVLLNTFSSSLQTKGKHIFSAIKYLTELISIFLSKLPEILPDNESSTEICELANQSIRKLTSLINILSKQSVTNPSISELKECIDKFEGFELCQNMKVQFNTCVLSKILSLCLDIHL